MTPGYRIGPYEIAGPLGAGGMGEVYRARDTKLNRDVAIKVLPEAFAQDADRMARFTREAQVLASLNHPNIAVIYAVEESALVMELVPGATLEDRIGAGAIPLDEALPIARQIAEGLEAAHERGIMHRDLKPANIKITPEGVVKLLDFGLAKTADDGSGNTGTNACATKSPTLSLAMTQTGMIMGTAGYMAPEQAAGKVVDKRADIWSFGVVLYEILGGKRLFEGETVAHTLADVLRAEIDLGKLPASTPTAIRKLLRRCLERNLKKRLRDIGEARILLEDLPVEEAAPAAQGTQATQARMPVARAAAAILALAVVALGFFLWRATRPVEHALMRFSVDLGPDAVRGAHLTAAISPDGTRLVFPVRGASGSNLLATRLLDQSKPEVLSGTEGAIDPFFSPDGQWIGFFADQSLKKISVHGGAAVPLCATPAAPRGGAWGEDGYIIADLDNNHLVRVPEAGGTPEMLPAKPEEHHERTWRWPQILPGGSVLFTGALGAGVGGGYEDANIEVLSLKTGKLTVVQHGGYFGRYLPTGHLVFVHQGTLFGVPFDLAGLKTRGTPLPVLDDVAAAAGQGSGQLDFASALGGPGTFVYLSGKSVAGAAPMAWMDSAGKTETLLTTITAASTPRVSPDGQLVALATGGNIVVYDPKRDARTPLTFDGLRNSSPVWAPDGRHLIFSQQAGPNVIWWIRSDGSGRPQKLFAATEALYVRSISPDGRRLAFARQDTNTGYDLWTLPLDLSDPDRPKPGEPELFLREPGEQTHPTFSPDGRWIAYASNLGSSSQVFVRPYPGGPSAGQWQISTNGGTSPTWSRDGKEIWYQAPDNRVMIVTCTVIGASLVPDKPRVWSSTPILRAPLFWSFDLAPDGKRVLAVPATLTAEGDEKGTVHVTVLLNFFDELKRRLP